MVAENRFLMHAILRLETSLWVARVAYETGRGKSDRRAPGSAMAARKNRHGGVVLYIVHYTLYLQYIRQLAWLCSRSGASLGYQRRQ